MRALIDPNQSYWYEYFRNQANQSGHGVQTFHGVPYQRGGSLGGLFKGLFRMIIPLAKSAGKAIGRQAIHTGLNIANDVLSGQNVKQAAVRRVRIGSKKLVKQAKQATKQHGRGAPKNVRTKQNIKNGVKSRQKNLKERKRVATQYKRAINHILR